MKRELLSKAMEKIMRDKDEKEGAIPQFQNSTFLYNGHKTNFIFTNLQNTLSLGSLIIFSKWCQTMLTNVNGIKHYSSYLVLFCFSVAITSHFKSDIKKFDAYNLKQCHRLQIQNLAQYLTSITCYYLCK